MLDRQVEEVADDVRVRHAEGQAPLVRRYAETSDGAKSWKCQRRISARIEAGCNGLDIRYVVTNIRRGSAEWLYDTLYCERGQAENLRHNLPEDVTRRKHHSATAVRPSVEAHSDQEHHDPILDLGADPLVDDFRHHGPPSSRNEAATWVVGQFE